MATTLDRLLYNMAASAISSYLTEERIRKRMELQALEDSIVRTMAIARENADAAAAAFETLEEKYGETLESKEVRPFADLARHYIQFMYEAQEVSDRIQEVSDRIADRKIKVVSSLLNKLENDPNIPDDQKELIYMHRDILKEISSLPANEKASAADEILGSVAKLISTVYANNEKMLREYSNEVSKQADIHKQNIEDLFGPENAVSQKIWAAFGINRYSFFVDPDRQLRNAMQTVAKLAKAIVDVDEKSVKENDALYRFISDVTTAFDTMDIERFRSASDDSGVLTAYFASMDTGKFEKILNKLNANIKGLSKGDISRLKDYFGALAANVPKIANEYREYAKKAGGKPLMAWTGLLADALEGYKQKFMGYTNQYEDLEEAINAIDNVIGSNDYVKIMETLLDTQSRYSKLIADIAEEKERKKEQEKLFYTHPTWGWGNVEFPVWGIPTRREELERGWGQLWRKRK